MRGWFHMEQVTQKVWVRRKRREKRKGERGADQGRAARYTDGVRNDYGEVGGEWHLAPPGRTWKFLVLPNICSGRAKWGPPAKLFPVPDRQEPPAQQAKAYASIGPRLPHPTLRCWHGSVVALEVALPILCQEFHPKSKSHVATSEQMLLQNLTANHLN